MLREFLHWGRAQVTRRLQSGAQKKAAELQKQVNELAAQIEAKKHKSKAAERQEKATNQLERRELTAQILIEKRSKKVVELQERVRKLAESARASVLERRELTAQVEAEKRKSKALQERVSTLERQRSEVATSKFSYSLAINLLRSMTLRNANLSFRSGITDWDRKWQTAKGKRILLYAYMDYSASFYKWADAINRFTPHAARLVTLHLHRYGYPVDLLYCHGALLKKEFPASYDALLTLADEADLIHIKDQTGFHNGRNGLPRETFRQFGKPLIFTHYGGTSRRDQADDSYRDHVRSFDAVVAMTPDLCFDWIDSTFIPHSIDTDEHQFQWTDGRFALHTPSTPSRKATDEFRIACQQLQASHGIDFRIVTGVAHDTVMAMKPNATIFFDQAGRERAEHGGDLIGWYGNSALEAAVFGVPTMAHLAEEAFARAERSGRPVRQACAILNVEPTVDSIRSVMQDFFESSPNERLVKGRATRKWIEDFHSQRAVAAMLSDLYESL